MNKRDIAPFAGITSAVVVAAFVALAGSYNGAAVGGLRIFALCAIIAFAIQWLAFIPAYLFRTEKFFDLTGSLTYITIVGLAIVAAGGWEPRSLILAALVLAWAVRLGSFLFARVLQSGGDSRFDDSSPTPLITHISPLDTRPVSIGATSEMPRLGSGPPRTTLQRQKMASRGVGVKGKG